MITPQNQIENIRQTGGSDLAKAHQVLIKQLSIYLKELRTLENASLIDAAQQVLINLSSAQECEWKKVEE